MTSAFLVRVALGWAIAATIQLVLWLVQQRKRNAGIVDVGWALCFTPIVLVFAWCATACARCWVVLVAVVCVWSLRLGGYLILRGAARSPEEGRYAELRRRWAPHASRSFFLFFQAQAALAAVLSSAFVIPFIVEPWEGSAPLRAAGAAISIVGILGESVADLQLARFKRDAANKGKGAIVNLASVAGLRMTADRAHIAYSTTKLGILALSKSTAISYAKKGIRCNTVIPGLMHTALVEHRLAKSIAAHDLQGLIDKRNASCPTGKMGDAWDIAHAVLFLVSDEARYITATEILVDGGLTAATGLG